MHCNVDNSDSTLQVEWAAKAEDAECPTMQYSENVLVCAHSVLRETYFFVGRAKLDCLEGGTHEETLRPQVNPKVKGSRF